MVPLPLGEARKGVVPDLEGENETSASTVTSISNKSRVCPRLIFISFQAIAVLKASRNIL